MEVIRWIVTVLSGLNDHLRFKNIDLSSTLLLFKTLFFVPYGPYGTLALSVHRSSLKLSNNNEIENRKSTDKIKTEATEILPF